MLTEHVFVLWYVFLCDHPWSDGVNGRHVSTSVGICQDAYSDTLSFLSSMATYAEVLYSLYYIATISCETLTPVTQTHISGPHKPRTTRFTQLEMCDLGLCQRVVLSWPPLSGRIRIKVIVSISILTTNLADMMSDLASLWTTASLTTGL